MKNFQFSNFSRHRGIPSSRRDNFQKMKEDLPSTIFLKKKNSAGFTLIELLIVVAIIAVIAVVVFVAVNPLQRFQDARNSRRYSDTKSIVDAIRLYQIENKGLTPPGLDTSWRMLGTATSGCDIACGESTSTEISYASFSELNNYYDNNIYSVRNWFNAASISDFSAITISAILDCNGTCKGTVKVRIGNTNSYADYDLVDASTVRTDGTTNNYTWYSNTFKINKNTLGNYFFVQLLLYTGSGTMRFMMDELGPAGPDAEYRMSSNGDGSQTGWTNDNGDYFIKVSLSVPYKTMSACLNLSSDLSTKLNSIPQDPSLGTPQKTYYAVNRDDVGKINAQACGAEGINISTGR